MSIGCRVVCEECPRHTDYDLQVHLHGFVVAVPPDLSHLHPAAAIVIDGTLALPEGWAARAVPEEEPARWAFYCADHAVRPPAER